MTDEFDDFGELDDELDASDGERAAMDRLREFREEDIGLRPEVRARLWRQLSDDPEVRARIGPHLVPDTDTGDSPATDLARGVSPHRVATTPVDRAADPGPLPSVGRRTATVGLVAAALVAVVLAFAVTGPTHPAPQTASEDTLRPTTTTSGVPSLDVVADHAAARRGPVLGEPGATYAHRVTVRQGRPAASGEPTPSFEKETWIAIDGNGRRINEAPGEARGEEDTPITDGSLRLADLLAPHDALTLPTEPEPLLTRLRSMVGAAPEAVDVGNFLIELLAEAGMPPQIRAALFRGLHLLGFHPTDAEGPGPAYEGPGIGGGTFVVVLGDDTVPRALRTVAADGTTASTTSYAEVDLRPDLISR